MNEFLEAFDSVESVIADVRAGKAVIVTDDENRENEGDLVFAAEKITPEDVNMMVTHARGLICAPTAPERLERLGIAQMVRENRESHKTAFTVSVDAAHGVTTGISAADRAKTIRLLANPEAAPDALVQPGHIFPLRARPGGVLERAGHTEAAVDLARLAGLEPAGAICEILNEDGTMARLPQLVAFKRKFGIKLLSIAQLIEYRARREKLVERLDTRPLQTPFGAFIAYRYRSALDGARHWALVRGHPDPENALVRMHRSHALADLFGAGAQNGATPDIARALARIAAEGAGVFVYLTRPEDDFLSDTAAEDPSQDLRLYGAGAQILRDLGLKRLRLLSEHPKKIVAIEGWNLEVASTETF